MQIAIVLYPGMTALDVVGPYEVLRLVKDVNIRFVWHEPGPVMTDSGILELSATHTFDETPAPDIVLIGGSPVVRMTAARDDKLLDWLRKVNETSTWTTSVCSGSVVLATAGILDGVPATSHWEALSVLAELGAIPQADQRIVRSGKIVTAAGVSAGLDFALWLAAELEDRAHAEAIQLVIEYDPHPPFDSGHMSKASAETKALTEELAERTPAWMPT
ncbi:DJ-1/PfpI family protein [Smaragdicoccus niigatensis]|uniref:DJ-1/PfpI family protein n=1 Tax=Smaragdicoccus niigatensis TaxID=359359 RepID=UPI00036554D7|nr:DJ-1/PfpI family protein [Smaragdicoccus niigatensis]